MPCCDTEEVDSWQIELLWRHLSEPSWEGARGILKKEEAYTICTAFRLPLGWGRHCRLSHQSQALPKCSSRCPAQQFLKKAKGHSAFCSNCNAALQSACCPAFQSSLHSSRKWQIDKAHQEQIANLSGDQFQVDLAIELSDNLLLPRYCPSGKTPSAGHGLQGSNGSTGFLMAFLPEGAIN